MSEADKLRDDIANLQLSSRSTGSSHSLEALDSPRAFQSDSSVASGPAKKEKNRDGKEQGDKEKRKKRHKDKDGEDLVKDEDLEILHDLGAGNGGTVTKVWNKKRKCIMARKVRSIFYDALSIADDKSSSS